MAYINNSGAPKFSQFCSATKENADTAVHDLPAKNMYWEMIKKLFGRSDHSTYVIVTGQ